MSQEENENTTNTKLLPYMFEPERPENDSDWETCSSSISNRSGVEEGDSRVHLNAEEWCSCENCQRKTTDIECVCCRELTESKSILEKKNLSKSCIKIILF